MAFLGFIEDLFQSNEGKIHFQRSLMDLVQDNVGERQLFFKQ